MLNTSFKDIMNRRRAYQDDDEYGKHKIKLQNVEFECFLMKNV